MERAEVVIRVTQGVTGSWSLSASLSRPHHGSRGLKWVPMRTVTRSVKHPYIERLSEGIVTEWVTALMLVAAGYYETPALPFE